MPIDRQDARALADRDIRLPTPKAVAMTCGALTILIGAAALVGWTANWAWLISVNPQWSVMQPLTAVGLVLCGLALVLGGRGLYWPGLIAVALGAVIAGTALIEHVAGLDIPGVDDLLFPNELARRPIQFPGRMSELAAIEFLLFAASAALCRARWARRLCTVFASIGLALAGIAVAGYLLDVRALARMGSYSAFAFHTGIGFCLLFWGRLSASFDQTWLRDVLSRRTGGRMARRLLPVAVGFPILVGVLASQLGAAFHVPPDYRIAIAVIAIIIGLASATVSVARALNNAERRIAAAGRSAVRSEAQLRSIVDTAVDAMVVIDDDGTILLFNGAAQRIFGYSAPEAVGRDVGMLMPDQERSRHDQYLTNYKRTGQAKIIGKGRVVSAIRKDGSIVPIDLSIAEWWDGGQRFFTGIMRDVSRRKAAEERLAASEANFRSVFEQAAVGIKLVGPDGRLENVNQKFCDMLGYSREELLNLSFEDISVPEDLAAESLLLAEIMDGRRDSFVMEKRFIKRNGAPIWTRLTSSCQRADGGSARSRIAIVEDITQQKETLETLKRLTEEAERAKREAERASRDKSRFLAAASHDLRQPVQALVLFTTALVQQVKTDPAVEIANNIHASLTALQKLLEGLLDVSRLDAGVITPEFKTFSIGGIIDHVVADCRVKAEAKGLALTGVHSSCQVRSDPALLERILRNLVENAVRYTDQGRILVGCRRHGRELLVQVMDTGIGIPPEQHEAVYQEFYQVGNPERDRTKGLGLGLAIIRRLARLLDHQVSMSSSVGRGTCFTVHVPLANEPRSSSLSLPDEPVKAEGHAADSRRRVLVIDDEAMVRLGLTVLLESWGWEVAAAADEKEATDWLKKSGHCPDVILADYRLREGHVGTEAVRKVRSACGWEVPSVIITGDTSPERLADLNASGFPVAHKPIAPEHLRKLVGAALTVG